MNKDSVYFVWTNPENGNRHRVGILWRENNMYYFKYIIPNTIEAQKDGFSLLIPFPHINATYECPHLFAAFGARLPEPSRPDLDKILKTYGLKEYDEFELLKKSGAKLPTDHYEFEE